MYGCQAGSVTSNHVASIFTLQESNVHHSLFMLSQIRLELTVVRVEPKEDIDRSALLESPCREVMDGS